MRSGFALVALLVLHAVVRADMSTPGHHRVPHDFVIDLQNDVPAYRFWLVSARGIEPLPLARGRPYTVDGRGRDGSHRLAYVVAAPAGVIERMTAELGEAKTGEAVNGARTPAGVLRSEPIDFLGEVPFYDTRERVIDRYQLVVEPPGRIRMDWVERNVGDPRVKYAWAVSGVCTTIALISAGVWVLRRTCRAGAGGSARTR